jgi:hypothetical protein
MKESHVLFNRVFVHLYACPETEIDGVRCGCFESSETNHSR